MKNAKMTKEQREEQEVKEIRKMVRRAIKRGIKIAKNNEKAAAELFAAFR